jgi:hypothetical protein
MLIQIYQDFTIYTGQINSELNLMKVEFAIATLFLKKGFLTPLISSVANEEIVEC